MRHVIDFTMRIGNEIKVVKQIIFDSSMSALIIGLSYLRIILCGIVEDRLCKNVLCVVKKY